jgi:hypothetical protein
LAPWGSSEAYSGDGPVVRVIETQQHNPVFVPA